MLLANAAETAAGIFQIAVVVAIVCGTYRWLARLAWGWIQLPPTKFWQLVGRAQQPIVLLTLRGFLRRRPCYLYPYHGIVFYTWSRPDELPSGVSIVSTTDAPV
ncbi:MAG: hypothetical protein QOE70_2768 [Chthoniobacter sp.]|jgi:hypothetical protein|nr:hypothetical protein [Chthoniobacter sp.]